MKYIITESQYNRLNEENDEDFEKEIDRIMNESEKEEGSEKSEAEEEHEEAKKEEDPFEKKINQLFAELKEKN
jgi:hypothetical protein